MDMRVEPLICKCVREVVEQGAEKDFRRALNNAIEHGIQNDIFEKYKIKQVGNYLWLRYDYEKNSDVAYDLCHSYVIDLSSMKIVTMTLPRVCEVGDHSDIDKYAIMDKVLSGKKLEIYDKVDGESLYISMIGNKLFMHNDVELGPGFTTCYNADLNVMKEGWFDSARRKEVLKKFEEYTIVFKCIGRSKSLFVDYLRDDSEYMESDDIVHTIVLTDIIDNWTGNHASASELEELANELGVIPAVAYNGMTLAEALDRVNDYKVTEKIGYILSIDGRRAQLTSEAYKNALYRMNDYVNEQSVVDKYINGEIGVYPELALEPSLKNIYNMCADLREYEDVAAKVIIHEFVDITKKTGKNRAQFFKELRKREEFLFKPLSEMYNCGVAKLFTESSRNNKIYSYKQIKSLISKYRLYAYDRKINI